MQFSQENTSSSVVIPITTRNSLPQEWQRYSIKHPKAARPRGRRDRIVSRFRLSCFRLVLLLDIPRQDEQPNAIQHLAHPVAGNRADLLCQVSFVDGEYLRDVDDTLFGEVGLAFVEQHIARGLHAFQIRGQRAHHDRIDAASVEQVVLDD